MLIERLRQIADDQTDPTPMAVGVRTGMKAAADLLQDACTPRPPKPEWFGDPDTEPGKWDAWKVRWDDYEDCDLYSVRAGRDGNGRLYITWLIFSLWEPRRSHGTYIDHNCVCLPIAREGYPDPVGWSVVGG